MANKKNKTGASLSIYQLMENFDVTEKNLAAFISNETNITQPIIVQINMPKEKTTWFMLGGNTNLVQLRVV